MDSTWNNSVPLFRNFPVNLNECLKCWYQRGDMKIKHYHLYIDTYLFLEVIYYLSQKRKPSAFLYHSYETVSI